MTNHKLAEKVLNYWFTIEFFAQDKFPSLSDSARKSISDAKSGKKIGKALSDVLVFNSCDTENIFNAIQKELRDCGMSCTGNLTFYLGSIKRECCIRNIARSLSISDTRPEISNDSIAWMSLQYSPDKRYIEKTLSLSTIIWALNKLNSVTEDVSSAIDIKKYSEDTEKLEKEFFNTQDMYTWRDENEGKYNNTTSDLDMLKVLKSIIDKTYSCYIEKMGNNFLNDGTTFRKVIAVEFTMYKDIQTREQQDEDDYLGLSHDFYSDDIKIILESLRSAKLEKSTIGMSLLDYICELSTKKYANAERIDLVHPANIEEFKNKVYDIIDIRNAPLGKWPSRYSPAFMQQVAINLQTACGKTEEGVNSTVFSVNGPPGTGKTTLLKEIIVSNVVQRAKLLAQYEDPDDAFVEHSFIRGDKENNAYSKFNRKWYSLRDDRINEYSILVASNNNAAVENISKELPIATDIFDSLKPEEADSIEYKTALKEAADLFDVDATGLEEIGKEEEFKDIFFTKHANNLLKSKSAWGLISASLGKKSYINNYYWSVIRPVIFSDFYYDKNNAENRISTYRYARTEFKKQLELVETIENKIAIVCNSVKKKRTALYKYNNACEEYSHKYQSIRVNIQKYEDFKTRIEGGLRESEIKRGEKEQAYEKNNQDIKQIEQQIKKIETDTETLNAMLHEKEKDLGLFNKIFRRKKYLEADKIIKQTKESIIGNERDKEYLNKTKEILLEKRKDSYEQLQMAKKMYQKNVAYKYEIESNIKKQRDILQALFSELKELGMKYKEQCRLCESVINRIKKAKDIDLVNIIDDEYIESLTSADVEKSTQAQVYNPWTTKRYDIERIKLFIYAMRLNKEFVLSTNKCRDNLKTLAQYWGFLYGDDKERIYFYREDREAFAGALFQTLFLFTPVISSTFASTGRMFKDIKEPGVIGTLIIDEAGQAQPQTAIGAMYRSRKVMIVGDPKQVEPIVTDDLKMLKKAFNDPEIKPYSSDKTLSVQGFADSINKYGTFLFNPGQDEETWVGCPLVVHRRCISPMYDISNELSYNGIMKQQTKKPKPEDAEIFVYNKSQWINIKGQEIGKKNHYVPKQGEKVCEILDAAFSKSNQPNLYIISPFTTVVTGIQKAIKEHFKKKNQDVSEWTKNNIGTVHKFQGREANEVIFLLGCDASRAAKGAVTWVNSNIVNVAATRAKYRLYVIGDIDAWKVSHCVSEAKKIIDTFALHEIAEVNKANISKESKEKALVELSEQLPAVTAFSVGENIAEDGSIEYNVDTTSWIKGLDLEFLNYRLSAEQLKEFGFTNENEIDNLPQNVQENIKLGIKLYSLLTPVYEINNRIDASCCAILFCKAIELYAKDVLISPLKRILPDYLINGVGEGRNKVRLQDARDDEFTLGAFVMIFNQNRKKISMATGGKYNNAWMQSFEMKMKDCKDRRNLCCHSGMFNWGDQEQLRFDMFSHDNTSEDIHRVPPVGGLIFELGDLGRSLCNVSANE